MTIEIALSVAVLICLGGMTIGERLAIPDPKWQNPPGWRGRLLRADLLLALSIALCLTLIWLPLGDWKR